MPRQARQESQTGYYHVMMRGINREFLFRHDADKRYFILHGASYRTEGTVPYVPNRFANARYSSIFPANGQDRQLTGVN